MSRGALPGPGLALALLLLGASPFREEHPRSREARQRIAAGEPGKALDSYAALEREAGSRPEIDLGRGSALLELGRGGEAREAFARAREAAEPLGSRALLGLGWALASEGDVPGAIAATREALVRDPEYEDARHNLESLLRRQARGGPPRPEPAPPRGSPAGPRDRGAGPTGEGEPADAARRRPREGAPEESPKREAPAAPTAGERQEEREGAGGADPGGRLSRREAERLLDALRARERNLPPVARVPSGRRPDAGKDW